MVARSKKKICAAALPKFQISIHDVYKHSLFAPFSASSKATSWSTYSSMSYEVALKAAQKYIKNQMLRMLG
jgi:hypothetical protein